MSAPVLPFTLSGFRIERVRTVATCILIEASALQLPAICPQCQTSSHRVHSRYIRTPRDLPSGEHSIRLILHVRRFFCDHPTCSKRTFAEPLSDLVPFRAQRTLRLSRTLEVLGFSLGGEAGAHISTKLRMPTSASSLLRIVRQVPLPLFPPPRVVGVDDFALRRGRVYATILVDLERHRPIDLLPDRTAETFAAWLRRHPGVEVIARDRSTEYTRGATEGAPTAIHVVDRWHLLQNWREAVERVLHRHHTQLEQLPLLHVHQATVAIPLRPQRLRPRTAGEQVRQDGSRQARLARYEAVRQLVAEGVTQRAIARQLQLSRTTIRLFAAAETFPERAPQRPRASIVDPFLSYLEQRWREGCSNGAQLWRELRARGYTGAQRHILHWLQHVRNEASLTKQGTPNLPAQESMLSPVSRLPAVASAPNKVRLPSARQLVWLFVRASAALSVEDHVLLQRLRQDPHMECVYTLTQQFQHMVRRKRVSEFADWLHACATSGISDVQTFAATLRRDEAAIRNALTEPWSTGPVEGHITRVKCLKRQMYGRASFSLLRQRVLHTA